MFDCPLQIGGHLTAHKNNEMTVGKGVQHTIDVSVAKEATRSLVSSARQSRRGPYELPQVWDDVQQWTSTWWAHEESQLRRAMG